LTKWSLCISSILFSQNEESDNASRRLLRLVGQHSVGRLMIENDLDLIVSSLDFPRVICGLCEIALRYRASGSAEVRAALWHVGTSASRGGRENTLIYECL
jgi:hypothetical protein